MPRVKQCRESWLLFGTVGFAVSPQSVCEGCVQHILSGKSSAGVKRGNSAFLRLLPSEGEDGAAWTAGQRGPRSVPTALLGRSQSPKSRHPPSHGLPVKHKRPVAAHLYIMRTDKKN